MASVMAASRNEQSVVIHEQIKTQKPKKYGGGTSISKAWWENSDVYGGVILNPHSHSVSLSVFRHHNINGHNQQPPLLPLPTSTALEKPVNMISRSLSQGPPPPTRRNRVRDASLTSKRSKQGKRDMKSMSELRMLLLAHPTNRMGPDPVHLHRHFPQTFSDMVFNMSPPPSSLPLPKFTLRPKLAPTDDLRRLLRLP